MRKFSKIIWGLLLVAAGVVLILNAFDILDVDLFFDGWWTLFIIIPCLNGLIFERDKIGNLVGLSIGVILLLWRQGIVPLGILWKLIVPVVIIGVGLKLIFGAVFKKKSDVIIEIKDDRKHKKTGCAVFSGCEVKLDGEVFDGGELVAVFGGVECDLRNAIIEKDCVINAVAVFGGIDILLPTNVNVQTDSFAIFGGIDDQTRDIRESVTVYVKGVSVFGGIDVK